MKNLKTETATPLYQQIYAEVRGMIEKGVYIPGQQIPSESELTAQFNVSRVTVRSALKKLVDENFLIRRHGKGTYVAMAPKVESFTAGGSFTESCRQQNIKPETTILSSEYVRATRKIASALRVDDDSLVTCMTRVRKADGIPVIYEVDYFPMKFEFRRTNDNASLLEYIRRTDGALDIRFEDTIDVVYADAEKAQSLDCAVCAPLLHVFERVRDGGGRVIYCNHQYIVSERYKYAVRKSAL